ncbi:MAG: hypothetical protein M3P51_18420 [Chloroflexota bacterium]|nr:hypothetical protein [Chloroflexota bacterium]
MPQALYTDDLSGRPSMRLGEAEGRSPAWSDGNEVLALVREKAERPLVLRAIDPKGATRDAGLLPLSGGAFAAKWDVAHARSLIATLDPSGFSARRTYWLALWTEGEGQ